MKRRIELFVPGRLCLFGEHSDWAGRYMAQNADILSGKAIVTGINLGITANAERADHFIVHSLDKNNNKIEFECEMHRETLRNIAAENSYFCYCCGVAAYMRENYHVEGVFIDVIKNTLPMKKGLSSSAAICVLVAKAFNELYDLHLSTRGIMKVAYAGELLTKSRCGRLDQACAYGERPIVMEFFDEDINVKTLRVGKTFNWVFADLCAGKDTKKILTYLNRSYPYAQTKKDENVQAALGKDNHKIIELASKAIEEGNAERLGEIMIFAQKLFDEKVAPACPEQLTAPVLHSVLQDKNILKWIYGAKGVGSQGDGTVQFLAKDKKSQKKLVEYLNSVKKMEAFSFDINAGGKVRKAIIPIAGLGTRMYPETHFIKKAFLPVPSSDGVIKPVLIHELEELESAGIEEIIVIVGEGEKKEYEKLFQFEHVEEFREKLPDIAKPYYNFIEEVGKKLVFVEQKEKKGFGHAVLQAKPYISDEPVLLLLGDFVFRSKLNISCAEQTIQAYYKSGGKSIIAIKEISPMLAPTYGVVTGNYNYAQDYLLDITDMVEKPSIEIAKKKLITEDKTRNKRCFATFGQYILTDKIFDILSLEEEEFDKGEKTGEIDLSTALLNQAKNELLVGVEIAGESFDVGVPEMYYETFVGAPQNSGDKLM